MTSPRRTIVLYVMGSGRSGSTVLDVTIGAASEIVGTGELQRLTRIPDLNGICACGRKLSECPFWGPVTSTWRSTSRTTPSLYESLRRSNERMKRIPALSRRMPGGDTSFQEYATATSRLFDTIADTGRAKVVLDSSKHPVRALALARNERLDLRLIHLVRDPRAVAWSFGKSFGWNPRAGLERDMSGAASYRSAVKWMSVNLQCEWVLKRVTSTPAIRIRYEDFVVSPVQTISRLANFLELDLSDVTAPLSRHDELQIEHVVAGNRIRMQRSITVKADDEWARLMPTRDRAVVTSLSFPLMLRYGYR